MRILKILRQFKLLESNTKNISTKIKNIIIFFSCLSMFQKKLKICFKLLLLKELNINLGCVEPFNLLIINQFLQKNIKL